MYSVYKHETPSGKIYIGITKQKPANRWLNGKGYALQPYFYNAILKYGWSNIKHEVLFTGLTMEEAEAKEVELIAQYKSNIRAYGYNVERGGRVNKTSDETREKLRKAKYARAKKKKPMDIGGRITKKKEVMPNVS